DHDPVLESLGGYGRTEAGTVVIGFGQWAGRTADVGIRLEQWQPDILVDLFEHDADPGADRHGARIAADDIRREPHARILVERDDRDDIRRVEVRQPLLDIDGHAHDDS